jgi:hypothetical protein
MLWPNNCKAALVIGIDDFHPQSSSEGKDFGGDLTGGKLDILTELIKKYPKVKITLFLTPNWILKNQYYGFSTLQQYLMKNGFKTAYNIFKRYLLRSHSIDKFNILNSNFSKWREKVRQLTKQNISIGIHGTYHMNDDPPFTSEFFNLKYEEAEERLRASLNLVRKSHIPFEMGFAPPGWGVNDELLKALKNLNFHYIAGSADFNTEVSNAAVCKGSGIKNVSLIYPSIINGLINIPRNWDIGKSNIARAVRVVENCGVLGLHGHMCDELGNGITEMNIRRVEELLNLLENKYHDQIWYASFGEVAYNVLNNPRRELFSQRERKAALQ